MFTQDYNSFNIIDIHRWKSFEVKLSSKVRYLCIWSFYIIPWRHSSSFSYRKSAMHYAVNKQTNFSIYIYTYIHRCFFTSRWIYAITFYRNLYEDNFRWSNGNKPNIDQNVFGATYAWVNGEINQNGSSKRKILS